MEECHLFGTRIENIALMKRVSLWHLGGLRPTELFKRIWKEINEDFIFDSGAALAYYWLLSIFPLLIFLITILSLIPSASGNVPLLDSLLNAAGRIMPGKAFFFIALAAERLAKHATGGLLTIGFVATLWSASSGVSSLMSALNRAYEIPETRSFIKRSLLAIGLTIGLTLLAVLGAALLVASDIVGKWIHQQTGLAGTDWIGGTLSALCGLAALVAGFGVMFYFGPSHAKAERRFVTPGLVTSVVLFLIASTALSIYVRISGGFSSAVYGVFGALFILLLWLYVLGLSILLGGELNSEIWKAMEAHSKHSKSNSARGGDHRDGHETQHGVSHVLIPNAKDS